MMRVRIEHTIEVDDDYRRAIHHFYGETGLATRTEVRDWFVAYGTSMDTDLMARTEGEWATDPLPK